jgi:hypothetical protein
VLILVLPIQVILTNVLRNIDLTGLRGWLEDFASECPAFSAVLAGFFRASNVQAKWASAPR